LDGAVEARISFGPLATDAACRAKLAHNTGRVVFSGHPGVIAAEDWEKDEWACMTGGSFEYSPHGKIASYLGAAGKKPDGLGIAGVVKGSYRHHVLH
jgi:hypothetical protein